MITPSLPTLSIALAIILPISSSLLAETVATCWISLLVEIGFEFFFNSDTMAATALSIPLFKSIGLAPAATFLIPVLNMACVNTVAVVVPSPALSAVLEATSFTNCAPIFSIGSANSISFATVTPSLVMVGAPNFLSRMTFLPFGPRVTFTASARASTPFFNLSLALVSKNNSLAIFFFF